MTPKQKKAWKEILFITNEDINPNWFEDEKTVQRHKELLKIVDNDGDCGKWKPVLTKDELNKRQLASRPGLEEKILSLVTQGNPQRTIVKRLNIPTNLITYVRKINNITSVYRETKPVPEKDILENMYSTKGIIEIEKKFNVSRTVAYDWLKHHGIKRNRRGGRKKIKSP
ncbi:hypothetical protein [Enterococcus alishanensis]